MTDAERVASVVHHQTRNTKQGPTVSVRAVLTVLADYSNLGARRVRQAISDAMDENRVVGLRIDGDKHLAPAEADALRAVVERAVSGDGATDQNLVAKCNAALEGIGE